MKKRRKVLTNAGGGGPLLTGTIGESKAFNCHCELRERAEAQSDNVKSNCHPELDSGSVQHCVLPVTPDRFRNKFGMTLKEMTLVCGFTMAEILLSLTIIGVVAAITLPSLTGNINERTWNTQRKALYARFSQAIALMPALNGYGTLTEGDSSTSAEDTAAETFVTAGLSKVLKINNICDSEHLADCGIPDKITNMSGGTIASFPRTMSALNSMMVSMSYSNATDVYSYSQIDTKAAAFETANGESLAVYYNPFCVSDLASTDREDAMQPKICANFIYDLNGTKGPNTVGKDIGFITVLYPTDSAVAAPMPHIAAGETGLSLSEGSKYCTSLDSEYRIPNKEEAASLFVNKELIGNLPVGWIATSSRGITSSGERAAWAQSTFTGNRVLRPLDTLASYTYVRCVKR